MAADFATDNYEIGEESTSLYKVESYQGTELSFDSYNELIHDSVNRVVIIHQDMPEIMSSSSEAFQKKRSY